MKRTAIVLVAAAVTVTACGDDEDPAAPAAPKRGADAAPRKADAAPRETGARITLADSEFGSMLFDSRKRAIYSFERDRDRRTTCYGDCAEAWPPVLTEGAPKAGAGVRQALLGTIERRGGGRQVTYAGKPLYLYAHEAPGEVRCHNVDLNGGLWWVLGPDGKRRP